MHLAYMLLAAMQLDEPQESVSGLSSTLQCLDVHAMQGVVIDNMREELLHPDAVQVGAVHGMLSD